MIVSGRITQALDWAKLEGPTVDRKLGGEKPMVDEWEAGTRTPTPEQMRLLVLHTGFVEEFFHQPVHYAAILCTRRRRCTFVWPAITREELEQFQVTHGLF